MLIVYGSQCQFVLIEMLEAKVEDRDKIENLRLMSQTTPRTLWRHLLLSADMTRFTSAIKQVLHRLGLAILSFHLQNRITKYRPKICLYNYQFT